MAFSYWMQNGMGARHTLVDMGHVNEQVARDATDKVKNAIGRGAHIQIVGSGRITLRIPSKRVDFALSTFPEIRAGGAAYCWCSHGWQSTVS